MQVRQVTARPMPHTGRIKTLLTQFVAPKTGLEDRRSRSESTYRPDVTSRDSVLFKMQWNGTQTIACESCERTGYKRNSYKRHLNKEQKQLNRFVKPNEY
jgi:uncharacterized C2H2 Zn-finger protein